VWTEEIGLDRGFQPSLLDIAVRELEKCVVWKSVKSRFWVRKSVVGLVDYGYHMLTHNHRLQIIKTLCVLSPQPPAFSGLNWLLCRTDKRVGMDGWSRHYSWGVCIWHCLPPLRYDQVQ
jgi:hypothetical protein